WFNLRQDQNDAKHQWFRRTEFRQAISYALDRDAIANAVYLGAAVPISGPVTPGNRTWSSESAPKYAHDPARAKALLASIGLGVRRSAGNLLGWNAAQRGTAAAWERQVDEVMAGQVAAPALADRQRIFAEVQRIMGEQVPAIWIVAPKVSIAMNRGVEGAKPA